MRLTYSVIFATLTTPLAALADSHSHSLDAHIHGLASLNVALEEQKLELQLASPAMNILGFEHLPNSNSDQQAVETAQKTLHNPALLFELNSVAKCTLTSTSVDNDLLVNRDDHDHHHAADVSEHQHSDITAHYHYHCSVPTALNSIDLSGFFTQFPHTEKIQVQLVTDEQQRGIELSAQQSILSW